MRTQWLALVLSVVMGLLVFAGCGSDGKDSGSKSDKSGPSVALVLGTGGLGDQSFNDSAYKGLQKAADELDADVQYVEPKEIAEFEGHFRDFAKSKKYDLILGIGFDQADAVTAVAAEFPDQKFVIIDGSAEGDNVTSINFKDEEKAYVLGTIAAMTTKTGKVGILGGMDVPSINVFVEGFKAGAIAHNKDVEIMVKYVGAFNDANTGKELALSMYDAGADIVMQAAGGSGLGVFSAGAERGKLAIGADVNQIPIDPDVIIASGMRTLDNVVFDQVKAVKEGTLKSGDVMLGFKDGGVDYTTEGTKKMPSQEALDAAAAAKQDIVDGKITPPRTAEEYDAFVKNLK